MATALPKSAKGNGSLPPNTKLKDSCDTCAASKIRCDKQKPLCGRCDRLNYPCFYSPARRTGSARPRGEQTAGSLSSNQFPGVGTVRTIEDRTVESENILQTEQLNQQKLLNHQFSTSRAAGQPLDLGETGNIRFAHRGDDASILADDTITNFQPPNTQSSSSRPNSHEKSANSVRCRSDCASVAMECVLELELTKLKLQLFRTQADVGSFPSDNSRGQQINQEFGKRGCLRTVITAYRSLSSILICPCFEQPNISFLAAAVTLSVLDVYSILIRQSCAERSESSQPTSDPSYVLAATTVEESAHWQMRSSVPMNSSQSRQKTFISTIDAVGGPSDAQRILKDLPRMARIIFQFAKRYRGESEADDSVEVLNNLAHLMKFQLQCVSAEAHT